MAIKGYFGLPGKGKTAESTYLAVKEYEKQNTLLVYTLESIRYAFIKYSEVTNLYSDARFLFKVKIWAKYFGITFFINFVEHFNWFKHNPINNIFTNYPVLLDPKRKIFSNIFRPKDTKMTVKFPKGSTIIWDEAQRDVESREFKKFDKNMGTFLQHHRHASITNIIFVSQSPKRIDNKLRDLAEVYRKYKIFFKIPFIPFIFVYYSNYYEADDYGKYAHPKPEVKNYDVDNHIEFISTKKSFDRYDSKYFSAIFDILPPVVKVQWQKLQMSPEEINEIGVDV